MNLIYLTVTIRIICQNPVGFFTLGILGSGSDKKIEQKSPGNPVLSSIESIPHAWYLAI